MRKSRFLVIPLVLFFLMACSLSNGIQQIKSAVTQLPALLTSAPTALGAVQTLAAGQTSGTDCGTSTPGGLGVALSTPKAVLEYTQQFTFTDSTVDGLPPPPPPWLRPAPPHSHPSRTDSRPSSSATRAI